MEYNSASDFLDKNLKWECKKCGACCRIARCNHLTRDNLCAIYDDRPLMCSFRMRDPNDMSLDCFLRYEFVMKGCV